ncbi:alpha/beta fold hydrolase [Thermoleophilia bacterium SCSIO 60948]|nr:alpha/beta fold hydrolase [Thermoleophilia bacterium SCSIO 60948]
MSENGNAERSVGGGLDSLLTENSQGPWQRWTPGWAGVKGAAKLLTRPRRLAARTGNLAKDLGKVAIGRSDIEFDKRDRRFKDPAWEGNPVFKRIGQTYLTYARLGDRLISDAELEASDERRVRFAADNVIEALAPTNFPATNPAVVKKTIDTGGRNLRDGLVKFVGDMSSKPRIPEMVDTSAFEVGENIALTEGAVVHRDERFELIQYKPQTEKVYRRPIVVVPPQINKYYIIDLAPERSLVEHLVANGHQVFVMSWKNPGADQADWRLTDYIASTHDAIDIALDITRADKAIGFGICAGGITLSVAAAHMAARGEDKLAALTLGVTILDNEHAGTLSSFADRRLANLAIADSAKRGYLDGRSLAGTFAWLRPSDLVWNYWVNNYLLGKQPPAFDILYWNSDSTNMPAGLHKDFIDISVENALVTPGALEIDGTPIDLSKVEVDSYVVAGIADHIVPWQNAYGTTRLLGSEPRFILSTSGHIAALVNPTDNEKASFQTTNGSGNPETAEEFLEQASKHKGSWWADWVEWLAERSGEQRNKPRKLGNAKHEAICDAPGTYVLEEA